MRVGLLMVLAAVAGAQGLEEKITGGKAKQLVDKAAPLIAEADVIYKAWVLEQIPPEEEEERLTRAIELYDKGSSLLQEALDLAYDGGVNHQCTIAARRLQKLRFYVEFTIAARKRKPPEKPVEPGPAPTEEPETPETPERPEPPPVVPAPGPPRTLEEDERPSAEVAFADLAPPAAPGDVALPPIPGVGATPEQQRIAKRDDKVIRSFLSDYYSNFKPNKLRYRHRLCGGRGTLGSEPCTECGGSGTGINLHHFRKAFWTSYTPLLRNAGGALQALEAFHGHARGNPDALGPTVKSFKVREVEYQGVWAKARVELNTDAGAQEQVVTLVSIGSQWFFYHPEVDRELLPVEVPR